MKTNIKSSDLPKIWSAPDNSRLIPKQISIRLPIHVAAKIYSLEEIYPEKNRTQIIADLLSTALGDLEESLPSKKGEQIDHIPAYANDNDHDINIYKDIGLKGTYFSVYSRKLKDIEKQLGNDKYNKESKAVYCDDEPIIMTSEVHPEK